MTLKPTLLRKFGLLPVFCERSFEENISTYEEVAGVWRKPRSE
jgi:hypothetical protein